MQGVTTAIVAFIFVCVIYPHLVKNRSQFYAALGLVLLVILLDAIAHMTAGVGATEGSGPIPRLMYVLSGFLQIGAILLLVLAAGGLTMKQLAGEVSETIEVIRRGDDRKTVIVPLRGEVPKPRAERSPEAEVKGDEDISPRTVIRETRPAASDASIPLE